MEAAQGRVMGRRPKSPNAIPRLRVRTRGRKNWYYYDHGGKPRREEALGSDYGLAIKRWAEIEHASKERSSEVITFRYVADAYRREIVPRKAPRTQRDNLRELAKLIEFFDDPPGPLDAIKPQHVHQYMTWRSAPIRANREKALLSHLWNFARRKGYTDLPNPCAGIAGNTERGRDAYIDDATYRAVWTCADEPLRDAMDVAYLTGQRPADVLRMQAGDIRDGALEVRQAKTGAKLRIAVQGELADVLARIAARKRGYAVHSLRLIVDEDGQPLGKDAMRYRFDAARAAAGVDPATFQFRDLRAKAATDKADASDSRQAQRQLGHASIVMTEHYIRARRGAKVEPTR